MQHRQHVWLLGPSNVGLMAVRSGSSGGRWEVISRGSLRGISWSKQVIGSLPAVTSDLQSRASDLFAGAQKVRDLSVCEEV